MEPIPLEIVDEIGSTSDVLKQRAGDGEAGPVALLARRQTGGRGRLGRVWRTIEGNLHLSVLLRPGALRHPGHWSLLAGVALWQSVRPLLSPDRALSLKWPNDLLLDGAKLAGILVEAGWSADPWLVIGFGVNLAGAPEDLDRATTSLAGFAAPPPAVFAADLLATLATWQQRYAVNGFDAVRDAWIAAGPRPGAQITARIGDEPVSGRFVGLGDDGSLLLDGPTGPIAVRSGEIG